MEFGAEAGLLIVGHGSTVNPKSSAPTWACAQEITRRELFAEVQCAFWKEEPSLRDARFLFDPEEVHEVYVVPNFISEGYFTQTVIPRELELAGQRTKRADGQTWFYGEPVGSHPSMTEMLVARAREMTMGIDPTKTALIIVGHGTSLNDNSAVAAKREVELIRARGIFGEVQNAYMEEPPLIAHWDQLTDQPNVVVVPFFISEGLHSEEDIPALLGIQREPAAAARVRGRKLFYARAIGTESKIADAIIEQARNARSVAHAG